MRAVPALLEEMERELCTRSTPLLLTPFPDLNVATAGLRGLTVLGARAGGGKSALSVQLAALAVLQEGAPRVPVIYVSLEMSASTVVVRLKQYLSWAVPDVSLTDERFNELYVEDFRTLTPDSFEQLFSIIETNAVQISEQYGTQPFIIVDSLHAAAHAFQGQKDERGALSLAMFELRRLADSESVGGVLILAHLNREGLKNHVADSSAFLGTATIEYYADTCLVMRQCLSDNIMFCTEFNYILSYLEGRELVKSPLEIRTHPVRIIEIAVAKNRFGPTPTCYGLFEADRQVFRNLTKNPFGDLPISYR